MLIQGFYLRLAEKITLSTNKYIHALSNTLLTNLIEGVTDIIPSYTTLYLEYNAKLVTEKQIKKWLGQYRSKLCVDNFAGNNLDNQIEIPVVYNGEDLQTIASETDLSVEKVVKIHSQTAYQVYALGFSAGFPFLGEVPKELRLPRLETPRKKVPVHSVAIAGIQTGIYPASTPGGWRLLGHSLVKIYDPKRKNPFLLTPGDKVKFIPSEGIPPTEPEVLELLPKNPPYPLLRVIEKGVLDIVVDKGRFLQGRFGLSRSGALDITSAQIANRLIGNVPSSPLLEMHYQGPIFETLNKGALAFSGYGLHPQLNGKQVPPFTSFAINKGDILSFLPTNEGNSSYLALAGGIDSKTFANSASVDLKNNLGRPLQVGDILGVTEPKQIVVSRSFIPYNTLGKQTTLRILTTEQSSPEILEMLCAKPFKVNQFNRIGIRFAGEKVKGGEIISEAAPLGAIQITPSGQPLLLLNDRGTLGGYSKPAVVFPPDLPKAAQLRPNNWVKFRPIKHL